MTFSYSGVSFRKQICLDISNGSAASLVADDSYEKIKPSHEMSGLTWVVNFTICVTISDSISQDILWQNIYVIE